MVAAPGSSGPSASSPEGTLAAAECTSMLEALGRLGVDPQAVLARAGMSTTPLDSPFARVPAALEHALWAAAEQVSGDRAIGLRVGAERARYGNRNLVEYIAVHAPTLRQAFASVQGVLALLDDRGHLEVIESGQLATLSVHRDGLPRARGYIEALLAGALAFGRDHLAGMRALGVAFTYPRPDDVRPYLDAFGLLPRFAAPRNQLSFPRSVLEQPLAGADPAVGGLLRDHAQALLERMPAGDPWLEAVRRALARELGAGRTGLEHVARALGVSTRTLRRKLAALGVGYHELLDELRCAQACHLLVHGSDSVDAIAERLGFSSRSGFQRAFRRYTGRTPSEHRAGRERG